MNTAELVKMHGGIRPTARALGCDPKTVRNRLAKEGKVTLPAPPEDDLPIERIRELKREQFAIAHKAERAETWFPIQVKDPLPIGVLWFGDPHVDDNGCNWPLLERHIELCRNTEGLYGANIGDTTNNWAGRLARLYADQDTSKRTAQRLAKWFLLDSGVSWLMWLMGNHDLWGDGAGLLRAMNTQGVPMYDWEARFRLCFPDGEEVRIHAAHNFKGFSDWNIGHGLLKAAYKTSTADLFVNGHLHDWCIQQFEMAGFGRTPTLIRVRGYKFMDHFAKFNGFQSAQSGAAILTIFNPKASDPAGRVMAFSDVEAGAAVLAALRADAAKAQRKKTNAKASRRRGDSPKRGRSSKARRRK